MPTRMLRELSLLTAAQHFPGSGAHSSSGTGHLWVSYLGNTSSKGAGTSQGWGKAISSSISFPISVLTVAGEVPITPFYITKGTGCFWMGSLVSPLLREELMELQLIAHTNLMEPVGPRSSALTKPLLPSTHHPSLKS